MEIDEVEVIDVTVSSASKDNIPNPQQQRPNVESPPDGT